MTMLRALCHVLRPFHRCRFDSKHGVQHWHGHVILRCWCGVLRVFADRGV
jgi:hypothetical protein